MGFLKRAPDQKQYLSPQTLLLLLRAFNIAEGRVKAQHIVEESEMPSFYWAGFYYTGV